MAGNPAKCRPYCLRESNWRQKRPPNRGLSARSILPGAVSNGPLAVDKPHHILTARNPCKFPHPHRYSQIGPGLQNRHVWHPRHHRHLGHQDKAVSLRLTLIGTGEDACVCTHYRSRASPKSGDDGDSGDRPRSRENTCHSEVTELLRRSICDGRHSRHHRLEILCK
jgi:hypothetical protein